MKTIYSIIAAILGAAFFVYGGYDDSPGAQGIGLIVVISGVVSAVKNRKK